MKAGRAFLLVPLVSLMALCVSCGSAGQQTSDVAATPKTSQKAGSPSTPACDSVWREGKTLPHDYAGCRDGDRVVEADRQHCESGQTIVTYGDRFYAAVGHPINERAHLTESKAYHRMMNTCTG